MLHQASHYGLLTLSCCISYAWRFSGEVYVGKQNALYQLQLRVIFLIIDYPASYLID